MSGIIDNYHNVQQDILETFVDREQLRKLAEPTVLPHRKLDLSGLPQVLRKNLCAPYGRPDGAVPRRPHSG
jgi:hypothetical protein